MYVAWGQNPNAERYITLGSAICQLLTHWPLGDLNEILVKLYLS